MPGLPFLFFHLLPDDARRRVAAISDPCGRRGRSRPCSPSCPRRPARLSSFSAPACAASPVPRSPTPSRPSASRRGRKPSRTTTCRRGICPCLRTEYPRTGAHRRLLARGLPLDSPPATSPSSSRGRRAGTWSPAVLGFATGTSNGVAPGTRLPGGTFDEEEAAAAPSAAGELRCSGTGGARCLDRGLNLGIESLGIYFPGSLLISSID